jgi:release factor glutamine methyltransferase
MSQEQSLAQRDSTVSEEVCRGMESAVRRILQGEPIAYVLGEWDFYGMRLKVTSDVLIPRDDTCAVTALAINKALFLGQDPRILDLCTGSGCIGLAVAQRVKDSRVTLADISKRYPTVNKVIYADALRGAVYSYGNHAHDKSGNIEMWEKIGETVGYA